MIKERKVPEGGEGYYTYFGYGDVPSGRVSIFTILVQGTVSIFTILV